MIRSLRTELRRTNYAGRQVTLGEGVFVVAATSVLTGPGAGRVTAGLLAAVGGLGLVDDLLEPRQRRAGRAVPKGLRGHLGALRRGHLTTGAAKALGIPVLCLVLAVRAPQPRGGTAMVVVDAALMAGTANLANLLDLRPGRALKAVLAPALLLAGLPAAGPRGRSGRRLAASAAVPALIALPADLREHGMLGDAGANILGAAVGAAVVRRAPAPARILLLGAVTALTVASERVSFSAVIDATPWLRRLDRWGRRAPRQEWP